MRTILLTALIALVIVYGGCSGDYDPISLTDQHKLNTNDSISFPVSVTDGFPDGSPAGGMGMLGVFNLSIDPANVSADLIPVRQTALTDVLEVVDITNFLQMAPCTDCAKIKSVALDSDNNIVVSIGIKHPFGVGNPLKPITGRNRADLHVFNVEGTIVSNLDCTTFDSGAKAANFTLVNANGYSGYLDKSLDEIFPTEATIHPYVLHFDDYSKGNFDPANPMGFESVTDPPPSGNLVMAMGSDYDYKDYVLDIHESLDFIFAVGCTYAVSAASSTQRFSPEYRIPQHNKKAASEVSIEIISNNLVGGDTSSTADLEIHVVDISHGVAVGDALDQMKADSSVGHITVDIPGITLTPITIDGGSAISGTGHDPSDPLVYQATVTNVAGGDMGIYSGLVKVIDTYSPGQNSLPILNSMDGIKRVAPTESPLTGLFAIPEFSTYQVFEIEVFAGGLVCDLTIDPSSPPMPFEGWGCFVFDASGSYDPGGQPLTFEWDFNNDGVFGDSYNAGTPDKPVKVFEFTNQEQVCVKVSDGQGGEETCCVDVDIVGYPSKNIPLRTDVEARDIGIDHANGDLLVLYGDNKIYEYSRSSYYQTSSQLVEISVLNLYVMFIDVAPNSYFYIVGTYAFDNPIIFFYDPDGHPPYPWQGISPGEHGYEVCAMTNGTCQNDPCWIFGRFFNSQYQTHALRFPYSIWFPFYDHLYYFTGSDFGGYDKLYYDYIKGCESDKNGNYIWFLEDPDYYASRWRLEITVPSFSPFIYDDAYFGTGSKTDNDEGWNNAKDITRDDQNRYFVLDELFTGEPRVKVWTVSGNITTSIGGFGNSTTISDIPRRIEGSDHDGNIVVLHGNSVSEGCKISVFFPGEMP